MYQAHYRIAGCSLVISSEVEMEDNTSFSLYRSDEQPAEPCYHVNIVPTDAVPTPVGPEVYRDNLNTVYLQTPELRLFRIPFQTEPAAWSTADDPRSTTLRLLPGNERYFSSVTSCMNAAGFENFIRGCGRYLFHCSYVDIGGRAILFTAPSGGGKTTQGRLWEQYAGAEMLNGDRAVLELRDGAIWVHGLPIAGSSGVFTNRSLPLAAIFVVNKASINRAVPMRAADAVTALFAQLTSHSWDTDYVTSTLDFAMLLASTVPAFRLDCTISPEAVEAAKAVL